MNRALIFIPSVIFFIGTFFTIIHQEHYPNPNTQQIVKAEKSGALEALNFWTQSRAYPEGDIPSDKYYKAYQYSRAMFKENLNKSRSTPPWQFIGPINLSGRMISVAINPLNPSTIYVGSASGGLWRSHSGGARDSWERVTLGYPVLGVNAIAIDPIDTNTMYIGTGEVYQYQGSVGGTVIRTTRGSYGMGLLKSTDGGATWTKSLDWSYNQQRGVQAIKINPQNSNTIFAATSEGVYHSTDAGTTWNLVLPVLMATDILINTSDTTLVMAACGNFSAPGAGLYLSLDAGTEWFQLGGGIPSYSGKARLEMYASDPYTVYASIAESTTDIGGLWKTTNFGSTWNLIASSSIFGVQGWYSHFVAAHPTDPSQIVLAGVGILKSFNGGDSFLSGAGTWADHHDYAHHPTNPDVLYVVDDGGVYRSEDFGDSYSDISFGLQTTQFYNGFSNSATDSLLALGQVQDHFGWMYHGSTSWLQGGVDEVGWTAINQSNDMIMYAAMRGGGGIAKSTNRGGSFNPSGAFDGFGSWNSPFVLSPSNTNVLYFGKNKIFKTTNASGDWTATNNNNVLDGNPALSMAISATHRDTVYVGTAPVGNRAHIYRTANGGSTWTNVTGITPDRYPMDLAVDPKNSQIVYATFGGFGTGRIYKSTNAGVSWSNITGTLPDVPTTAVVVDPFNSNHVYVGNDIGIYVSINGGSTWSGYGDGLPEAVIISDLTISPSNRVLRAATHGNGVYQRKLLSSEITEVVLSEQVPEKSFVLYQNYPNPFNPRTNLRFEIGDRSHVVLKVFDVLGREVATLVDEIKEPGNYTVSWDAGDLTSGVFYYQLKVGNYSDVKKLVLMR